ncbi:MAG: NAD(P)H-dependent oxidoreductase [Bacilli bacterium]|jgi:chromate reductase|nr:NAD(P)H-dependent oxidoreductase [Bacilli bacterium]
MNNINVAVIVGSLRKESFSRKIALALKELSPEGVKLELIDIGSLPLFNQDFEEYKNEPEAWKVFRNELKKHDAFLFVTPEYNRSFSGALKNALDVGSRPYGHSVWNGKPGAIVSVSPGAIGGFGANHHLRQVLTFLNVATMQQPEAYIGAVHTLLNKEGKVANKETIDFLKTYIGAFVAWVNKNN